jgi:NAD(P)-dependent dehydrogenase (short-subunit alcohol dehydrogenase family)
MNTISLVTGGNRGIGREVCRQLAARGHTVILTARSADRAARAARAVGAVPLQLDVTDADSAAAAARWVRDRFGQLDVLVNNAAICYDTWQRAATADLAVVREAAETNLYGPWLMVQAFLPLLHRSEHPRVVNVSSEAASLASMSGACRLAATRSPRGTHSSGCASDTRPTPTRLPSFSCVTWAATSQTRCLDGRGASCSGCTGGAPGCIHPG